MNAEQRRIQCWDIDAGYAAAHEKYRAGYSKLAQDGFQEIGVYCHDLQCAELKDRAYIPADEINGLGVLLLRRFWV